MDRYQLLYRVGFTPWERAPGGRTLEPLLGDRPGRALDVGCGSGRDAVWLAERGWRVTGVDAVDLALERAKERAAEQRVEVEWVRGDVADLPSLELEPGFDLIYDFGCLHGLPDAARAGEAGGITRLAAPGATLVILGFQPGRRLFLPRGIGQGEIGALFSDSWELEDVQTVDQEGMPRAVRRAQPTVYRLRRRDGTES